MTWPYTLRVMAQIYGFTPQQVSRMTPDQVWALTCEERFLKSRRLFTGTVEEIQAEGIEIDMEGAVTLTEAIEIAKRQQAEKAQSKD